MDSEQKALEHDMHPNVIQGFGHFLSSEHVHIEQSVAMLRDDYGLIVDLDNIFSSCLTITLPDDESLMIPAFLYLISHQEFYYGMASFLRLHKTQTFRSLRVALDSTFTAYYLLKNPEESELYLNRDSAPARWERIFRNIKLTLRNDSRAFPYAAGLLQVHDLCSRFAHADPAGILHKYHMDRTQKRLHVHYFDYERSPDDYRKWFAFFQFYFFRVFLVYWNQMLSRYAGTLKKEIAHAIGEYRNRVTILRDTHPIRIGAAESAR